MPRHKKLAIFNSCIVSKLLYSMDCERLRLADRARLDAFNCTCLRKILHIPHSMISRASNDSVRSKAGMQPLSVTLAARQLVMFGRIASLPQTSLVRQITFEHDSITPTIMVGPRRQGRPSMSWTSTLYAKALLVCSNDRHLLFDSCCTNNEDNWRWKVLLKDYFKKTYNHHPPRPP